MPSASDLARRGAERGVKTAAAWTLRKLLLAALGPTLAGLAGTNFVTAVAYGVIIQIMTVGRQARGALDAQGFRVETTRNVGWALGSFVGMSAGAIMGSIVPVVGTLLVSMVFGAIGGLVGAGLGRVAGWMAFGRPGR